MIEYFDWFYTPYVDDISDFIDPTSFRIVLHFFSSAHSKLSATQKGECNNYLTFLDIKLTNRSRRTIWRFNHRKATWSDQHLHSVNLTATAHKQGLEQFIYQRSRCICKPKALKEESFLLRTAMRNVYPAKVSNLHSRQRPKCDLPMKQKKVVCIGVTFNGDHIFNHVYHQLNSAKISNFTATDLHILLTNQGIILKQLENSPLSHSASHLT